MNITNIRQLFLFLTVSYVVTIYLIWNKVLKFAKRNSRTSITTTAPSTSGDLLAKTLTDVLYSSISSKFSFRKNISFSNISKMFNVGKHDFLTVARLASLEDDTLLCMQSTPPEWVTGPRDLSSLPTILEATTALEKNIAEYAFAEMLKIIERCEPTTEEHFSVLESAYGNIFFWFDSLDSEDAQPGLVLDAVPFLIENSAKYERLHYAVENLKGFLKQCLQRADAYGRQACYVVSVLLDRHQLPEDDLQKTVIPLMYELVDTSNESADSEHRVEIATVLCRIISQDDLKDRKWVYDNFIWRYSHLLTHPILHVRKVAIGIIGHLARMFGTRFTDMFSVPHLLALCEDPNWGVRKVVCENFVEVSKYCRRQTREKVLAPKFVTLLRDPSRWVSYAAFQELGPFISTFANSHVTGMKIMDGKVYVCGEEKDIAELPDNLWESPLPDKVFAHLPPGVLLPHELLDDQMGSDDTPSPTDNLTRVVDGLQDMLDTWTTSSKRKCAHSAPSSINGDVESCSSIAAKCNSVEDLSNIGLDDDNVVDMSIDSDEENDDDNGQGMDTTVIDYDENKMDQETTAERLMNICDTVATSEDNFNQLMYWSNDFDDFVVDLELQPFGASSNIEKCISFLDRRFDILAVNTANLASPKRQIAKVSPSKTEPPTQIVYPFVNDDSDMELFKDVSGTDDDEPMLEEEKDCENSRRLVPKELIESYMSMISVGTANDGDINRYCAHNFPAVAFTLGRSSWPQLRNTYVQLAGDDQLRVRMSIASSLHEMAAIIGSSKTETDLLPIFNSLRSDVPEVRVGVLRNLFHFVKCLPPASQRKMIEILPSFMPIDNSTMSSNWRYRLEFALQCQKLCDIYSIEDINRTMTAIALTLANDRVAEVRFEAVELVSIVLERIVQSEWNGMIKATEVRDNKSLAPISELFVQDIVSGFAKTQKWTRRQTFVNICEKCLQRQCMNQEQFRYFFLPHVSAMAYDKVPNVRIGVCRVLALLVPDLKPAPLGSEQTLSVAEVLSRLIQDTDMDVVRQAKISMRLAPYKDFIDITGRHERLQEREQMMIAVQVKDNYTEMDMSISPQKPMN